MYKYRKPTTYATLVEAQMKALEQSYRTGEEYHVYQDTSTERYRTYACSRVQKHSRGGINIRSTLRFVSSTRQFGWYAGLHKEFEDDAPILCKEDVTCGMWPRYKGGLK